MPERAMAKQRAQSPRRNARGRAALAIALLTLALLPVFALEKRDYDREIARQKQELDELRDRLKNEQQELANLRERKVSALGTLEKLAGNIRHTEEYLMRLDSTEGTLGKSLSAVREDLAGIEARIR